MKTRKNIIALITALTVLSVMLTSCQKATATPKPLVPVAPTQVIPVAPTQAPSDAAIGSAEHPIKVLFVPFTDVTKLTTAADIMAQALNQVTGLEFAVSIPSSYAATIEEMCASPKDTIGFLPGLGYVLANQLCGVDVAFRGKRYLQMGYRAQILVQRDSPYATINDLAGKKWGIVDKKSVTGYLAELVMFEEAGITPGETVTTGGFDHSVKALYNGEVDFSGTTYLPPVKPSGQLYWKSGDPADIPDDLIPSCKPSDDGKSLMCGDWRVLDSRVLIRTEAPDVMQKVRILAISSRIPYDTISFGPEFPADQRAKIETALAEFAKTSEWKTSIGSTDLYNWSGIAPAKDADYQIFRKMMRVGGITLDTFGK